MSWNALATLTTGDVVTAQRWNALLENLLVLKQHTTDEGFWTFGTAVEATIAGGVLTVTRAHHTVDTEADAASDDLDSIANGFVSASAGGSEMILLRNAAAGRTVVLKHVSGILSLAGSVDYSLTDPAEDSILISRDVTGDWWAEVARSG